MQTHINEMASRSLVIKNLDQIGSNEAEGDDDEPDIGNENGNKFHCSSDTFDSTRLQITIGDGNDEIISDERAAKVAAATERVGIVELQQSCQPTQASIEDAVSVIIVGPQTDNTREPVARITGLVSNNNNDEQQNPISISRRLVSIFRFWRSKTEMQSSDMNREVEQVCARVGQTRLIIPTTTTPGSPTILTQSSGASIGPCRHATGNTDGQRILFASPCTSALPFMASSLAGQNTLDEIMSERKPWQTLLMPLILGCIIFLVAVWARQISLILMNNTIIVVFIIFTTFLIMSGIAFWLSYDQSLGNRDINNTGNINSNNNNYNNNTDRLEILDGNNDEILQVTRQHNYHRLTHTPGGHHDASPVLQSPVDTCCVKCNTGIAIIDYQPPDYYSAMRNSFPVNLYNPNDCENNSIGSMDDGGNMKDCTQVAMSSSHADELQLIGPPNYPPSYDQLTNLR